VVFNKFDKGGRKDLVGARKKRGSLSRLSKHWRSQCYTHGASPLQGFFCVEDNSPVHGKSGTIKDYGICNSV
jgi:hypothetical protein